MPRVLCFTIMSLYVPPETLLDYLPSFQASSNRVISEQDNPSPSSTLDSFLLTKVDFLASLLSEIKREINERSDLSQDVINRIYHHYFYVNTKLLELSDLPVVSNRALELRRSTLESKLDELKGEKRGEQIQCWQDISKLRQEHRNWQRQHNDLVNRVGLILSNKE